MPCAKLRSSNYCPPRALCLIHSSLQVRVLFHQNYGQIFPVSRRSLADQARRKDLLGYHDIRVGNQPDDRLQTFLSTTLPTIAAGARARFDAFRDLLEPFARGVMTYREFAARVIRRDRGGNDNREIGGDPADWF
jgi:hypothetical protein